MLAGCGPGAPGQATRAADVRAAGREGEVVVYINNDVHEQVVADFERRFPKVTLRFVVLTSRDMQAKVIQEAKSGQPVADVVWTSAMDTQVKLINDGYAQTYRSPEAVNLPAWARWRDQGYGMTNEPIVFVYNKRLLPDAPRSHAALLAALKADPGRWRGKVGLYDPERSAVGFLYLSSNTQVYPDAWALYDAIRDVGGATYVPGRPMLDRVASGEHLLAFDMNGSYADWYRRNLSTEAEIGYIVPEDYHLSISRVAFIAKAAPHPHAARVFLDYLMSEAGQRRLLEARLTPVRAGLGAPAAAGGRPIRVGPALLANFDQGRREALLSRWRAAKAGEER
ncbi:hypothetical protein E1H18_1975 [Caulobacter sp. RHG1]|nr:hypothetical protein [Caulobacter sp. RHG1]